MATNFLIMFKLGIYFDGFVENAAIGKVLRNNPYKYNEVEGDLYTHNTTCTTINNRDRPAGQVPTVLSTKANSIINMGRN